MKYFLEQCLCSVQQAVREMDAEVFVVDNDSSDDTVRYLEDRFPFAKFLINSKNEGFARANNIALQRCTGDFILFLNPDTIIPENILTHCLVFFRSHQDAGAAGVRMVDGSGHFLPESKRTFPSPAVSFFKLSGLSSLFPRSKWFNKYALGFLPEDGTHEVDILSGAFLMARRELLQQLKGYDERFFMYGEDIDLCYRIKQCGYRNYYLGDQVIVHFKGESARQNTARHNRMFYDAMRVFVKKHYKRTNASLLSTLLHTGIYLRSIMGWSGNLFKPTAKKGDDPAKTDQFLLVGDPLSASEAERIIRHNCNKVVLKKIQSLRSLAGIEERINRVVFCTGSCSYRACIAFITTEKNGFEYKWHGLHTKSIVGSTEKNLTGDVYAELPGV